MTTSATSPQTSESAKNASQYPILEVRNLEVHFPFRKGGLFNSHSGVIRAVDGISFKIATGETLGLVGESGCGKSTTARALVRLVDPTAGEVILGGTTITHLSSREMLAHRRVVQMIFQDPYASLNPRMTVGSIIAEPMQILNLHESSKRKLEVMRLMDMVGLNPRFLNRYPHEFSGGQRQRIGIARALAAQPKLIVCDEPVSALDVSIQAQVINLLMKLQEELGVAYLFISHDLSVVRHISHKIGVMYLGRIVEMASSNDLHRGAKHPYTQALLSAAPIPDPTIEKTRQRIVLKGEVPSPDRTYPGCPFADRCPVVEKVCREKVPQLIGIDHLAACHLVNGQ